MADHKMERESLPSRLGFLLLAAGCAIGLGNIWRFPFVAGKYGGGAFVLLYLFFLIILGLPVLAMELSIGRASRRNLITAYGMLAPTRPSVWRGFGYLFFSGNLVLLMFYSTVSGWMPAYAWKIATGSLGGLDAAEIDGVFGKFVQNPTAMIGWMSLAIGLAMLVCGAGLRAGVERVVKWMMLTLLLMLVILCGQSLRLPGAAEGLRFYLLPTWEQVSDVGALEMIRAALGQAFFTLSVGVGSMEIFGSYVDKKHTLGSECASIVTLDTLVALLAGIIVFPACASFGVDVAAGPKLVFVTLPNIFNQMSFGRWWGTLFFVFMSLAALTTVIAVLENLVAFVMEQYRRSRKVATLWAGGVVWLLSIPCALGYNLLSGIQPFDEGSTILDFEDFIVSDNLLPLGALCMVIFCTRRFGWGWRGFMNEVNIGKGMKFPEWACWYSRWILPLAILFIVIIGYMNRFFV